ncbi:MAG: ammonia-forming cytochrome c nitrite reductase subunit c552 [Raoultibacter sp.]
MESKSFARKSAIWVSLVCAIGLVCGLAACAPKSNDTAPAPETKKVVETPAANANGIVTADSWKDIFPDEYGTYKKNSENNAPGDYTQLYPQIKVIWEGTPFSKFYNEPNGHTQSLTDISETGRNPKTANCLTCKSSEFILMQDKDPTLNTSDIKAMLGKVSEPISCYDCHRNDPQAEPVAIRQFFVNAVGKDADKLPKGALSCGQCHNEYLFPGANKAAENPYKSLADATPDKVLAAENALGYVDYTNPRTGTKHLKVQHPEFETNYGGDMSPMAKQGYSCATCHMPPATDASGAKYASHTWVSPLENEDLLKNDCSKCHKDIKAQVKDIQKTTNDRVNSVGDKLVTLNNKLADAVASGAKTEDELNAIRDLNRTSQFYWDWVMVENGDGAHNSQLAKKTLDSSEAAVDQALALLG